MGFPQTKMPTKCCLSIGRIKSTSPTWKSTRAIGLGFLCTLKNIKLLVLLPRKVMWIAVAYVAVSCTYRLYSTVVQIPVCWFLWVGGNPENLEIHVSPWNKDENQPQSNMTHATPESRALVGGERSRHCTTPALSNQNNKFIVLIYLPAYLGILPTNKVLQLPNLVINTGAVTFLNQIVSRALFCFDPYLSFTIWQTTDGNLARVQHNRDCRCKDTVGSLRQCRLKRWLTQFYSSNDCSSRIWLDNLWLEMSLVDNNVLQRLRSVLIETKQGPAAR